MHAGMSFFSRGIHGRDFDVDSQELGQLFQAGFFNWIGKGVVQPRPERPPFQAPQSPGILVPPHVSLQPEVPENDGWQEIVHRQSPNIVAGPIFHYLLPRLSTRLSKLHLSTHQLSPLMLAKG
jgi:hypothetical protein